ncbi:MAG TPA: 9-O-acetylesterase [Lentisphaeria bacterium]|nr:MAG: hypothetical protein A2X45_21140 [Lentisphaerae bacterium GWF2_50_93]HCE42045.1 9-O-acetylesterase [Lentisphaeria bacterium]
MKDLNIGLIALVVLSVSSFELRADVKMPNIFGDHMVIQQDVKVPVWGWADAGEEVTVTLGEKSARTKADANGKWRADLDKISSTAEPQTLVITGKNTVKFEDVLVGDVWICSGQSNMEYGYQNIAKKADVVDPQIRTFCVLRSAALTPLDDTYFIPKEIGLDTEMGHWQKENPAGPWGGFSAVGYLFGKEIRRITNKPVGLIGSYWGGTPAQAWTSLSGLEKEPALSNYVEGFKKMTDEQKKKFPVKWIDYVSAMKKWDKESRGPYEKSKREWEVAAKKAKEAGQPEPPQPKEAFPRPANPGNVGTTTSLFNGMINPLMPFAIKGVVWYQGESNSYNGKEYGILFPNLIKDWREKWGQGDFPFLFVQIAAYGPSTSDPTRGSWALLRDGQSKALALPNTAMAVAIDVGDRKDIHPKNKIPVAQRLALAAKYVAYGQEAVYIGPTYDSMKAEGKNMRLAFKNIGTGLIMSAAPQIPGAPAVSAPAELAGFEIAGADKKWFVAKAVIDGSSVLVSCDQVADPVAVRYAWGDFPQCNLYNKEGLPAIPFRTDDWEPKSAFATPE